MKIRNAWLAVAVLCVAGSAVFPAASTAQTELNLLALFDPCDCNYPPFDWSYNDVWGFEAGGSEFAIVGTSVGVYIVDVTTPSAPFVASIIDGINSNWRDIKVIGNYVLAVSEAQLSGLQVIDVSDPYAAFEVGSFPGDFPTAHNIYIDEATERAYVFGASGPVANSDNNPIFDVSDPTSPVLLGNYSDRYLHDGYVKDNVLYGAKIYDESPHMSGLYMLDVTDPASIDTLGIATWPNAFCHNTWTTEDGAYCLTTDENNGGHVRIWDVQNPAAPFPVSEYSRGEDRIVHNVYVRGDLAYISYYFEGVRVVDISDISNPVEIGYYDTTPGEPTASYGGVWGVYPFLPSGTILASDVENGLYIFEAVGVTNSIELAEAGTAIARSLLTGIHPNPFNPSTTISFRVPEGAPGVTVSIYDVHGHLVSTLHEGPLSAGQHSLAWNGHTTTGNPSASGTYYLRIDADGRSESQALVLVK